MDGDYTRKYRRTGPSRDSQRSKPFLNRNVRSGQAAYNYALSRRRQINRGFLGAAGDAKYVDIANNSYVADTTGSISHMSIIPQGTTVNQRDGKAAMVTSIRLRGMVTGNLAAEPQIACMMLVWDAQPNKSLAAVTDVLDSASSYSFPKRENAGRFTILRQWRYKIVGANDDAPQSTAASAYDIDEYVKLPRNSITTYTTADNTGVIGNCINGALLFVTVGNKPAGGTAATFYLTGRTNFVDI